MLFERCHTKDRNRSNSIKNTFRSIIQLDHPVQIEGLRDNVQMEERNLDMEVEAAMLRDSSRRMSSSSAGRKKRKSSSPKHR